MQNFPVKTFSKFNKNPDTVTCYTAYTFRNGKTGFFCIKYSGQCLRIGMDPRAERNIGFFGKQAQFFRTN